MKVTDFEFEIDNFMLYCTSKNLSKKTMKSYEQTLKLFTIYLQEQFNIEEVAKVQTGHIRQYIKYLQERGKYTVYSDSEMKNINFPENRQDFKTDISETTINNYLRNIKVFFNFLAEEREIIKSPVEKIGYLKATRKMKPTIKQNDFKALIKAFDTTNFHGYRNYIITKLLLDTGLGIGECLALIVDDIDLKSKIILARQTKNKQQRYVYLSNKIIEDIRRWLQYKDRYTESEYLFPTTKGNIMDIRSFEKQLRDAGKKAGLENIHPHALRNNFAKNYLLNGGDFFTLSRILGHSSVKVTEEAYMDLTPEKKDYPLSNHLKLGNVNNFDGLNIVAPS